MFGSRGRDEPELVFVGMNGVLEIYPEHLVFKRTGPAAWLLPSERVIECIPYEDLLDFHVYKPSATLNGYFRILRRSDPRRPIIVLCRRSAITQAEAFRCHLETTFGKLDVAMVIKCDQRSELEVE